MEKLVLMKMPERSEGEQYIEDDLSRLAEEISKLHRAGIDARYFLFCVGQLIIDLGKEKSKVEQYLDRR